MCFHQYNHIIQTIIFFITLQLLTVSPASRISSFESLQRIPYAATYSSEEILHKKIKPLFTPPVSI